MRYIDLNPKQAHKVRHPRYSKYSSFAYYAYGTDAPFITPAPSYRELSATPKRRQAAYLALI